jgi:dTDP-4-dehydrorhamnose 3,5-epimerase
VELYDPRWDWHPDPLVFAYCFTLRPGYVKGWNLHKLHEDRYVILQGEMELVLYDVRPDSSTCGKISRIVLSEHNRRLVNIPRFIWHADHNIGTRDAVVVNFPTTAYDHANPDKYRLPIDTPLIPYKFPGARGW